MPQILLLQIESRSNNCGRVFSSKAFYTVIIVNSLIQSKGSGVQRSAACRSGGFWNTSLSTKHKC